MGFVPGSVAAEKLGGQPASQAQGEKERGELPGPLPQQQATGAPAKAPPPHPTPNNLHSWAWASLDTISGPFFLAMLSS